jgi:tetratricopeptide (TPR) repeat protein
VETGASQSAEQAQGFPGQPEDVDEQIAWIEARLADLPEEADSRTPRLEWLFRLASLYQAKKAYDQSIQRLQHGKQIARQLNDTTWLARFWGKLGLVYLDSDQPLRAVRACRKATRLNPHEPGLWSNLGHFYHREERFSDAIIAYKCVIRLDPQNSLAKSGLAACYRQLGKHAMADEQKKRIHAEHE